MTYGDQLIYVGESHANAFYGEPFAFIKELNAAEHLVQDDDGRLYRGHPYCFKRAESVRVVSRVIPVHPAEAI
jgi:hypothetical protein